MKIVHGSPGFGVALSEQQTIDFLTKSKLNLLLGTIDEEDEPNVHPVWYLYENGKLYIETEKNAKKVKNLNIKKTAYFCVDDEKMPYRGVRGKGDVRIIEDVKSILPVAEKIMLKYTGSLDNKIAKFLLDGARNGFSVVMEITPRYYATWDHSTGLPA